MRAARSLLLLLALNLLLAGLVWLAWRSWQQLPMANEASSPVQVEPEAANQVTVAPPQAVAPNEPTSPPKPPAAQPAESIPEPTQPEPIPQASLSRGHSYAGLPRSDGYPYPLTLLVNRAFSVGYDESRRNPAWSAYRLPAETLPQRFPRPSRFRADVRTQARVRHEDYTGSGYDRGHLAPNHAIATRFGATAQTETFLMSNIIPQAPELNQGPWRQLEATLADRTAPACREIWVTVGPAYLGGTRRLASGSAVPDACWMVVADETQRGPRLQAFLMAQSTARTADYRRFIVSVDAVERVTRLDLFHELPDALENYLEAEIPANWIDGG